MMDLRMYVRVVPDFPKSGILFRDVAPLLASPDALACAIQIMQKTWQGKGVTKIAGFDARGFIFGSLLASSMSLPFIMLRKKGKLPGGTVGIAYGLEYGSDILEIADDAVTPGDCVLLVDDLLATGGTAKAGVDLVNACGGSVAGLACVIELVGLGGREKLASYPVSTLIQYQECT